MGPPRKQPRAAHAWLLDAEARRKREAARQMREAFPAADGLHEVAQVIGSTTVENIRGAGFDIMPNPTKKLPNHYRLIHPDGVAGFNDENLARLSAVFTETSGYAL
jgi:hypothetical protein